VQHTRSYTPAAHPHFPCPLLHAARQLPSPRRWNLISFGASGQHCLVEAGLAGFQGLGICQASVLLMAVHFQMAVNLGVGRPDIWKGLYMREVVKRRRKNYLLLSFNVPCKFTELRRELWGWWKAILAHGISSKALYTASAPLDHCAVNI